MVRRIASTFLRLLAATFAGLVFITAAAILRLSSGPLSLDFLTPHLADTLAPADSPYTLTIEQTALAWKGWNQPVGIHLRGLRAYELDGTPVAMAPEMSVSVSVAALLRGVIAPTRVEIVAPALKIIRDENGRIGLSSADSETAGGKIAGLLLAELAAAPDPEKDLGHLREIIISRASLLLHDRVFNARWRPSNANFRFVRDGDGVRGNLSFDLALGDYPAHFDIDGVFDSEERSVDVVARFEGLEPAAFAASSSGIADPVAGIRIPVGGTVAFRVDFEGAISDIAFDLVGGAGTALLPDLLEDDIAVTYTKAKGILSSDFDHIRIDDVFVDFEGPTLAANGSIDGLSQLRSFVADVSVNDLPVEEVARYWPPWMADSPREWIDAHLSVGVIRNAQIRANLTAEDLSRDRLPSEALGITMTLENITVDYLPPLPTITGVDAAISMTARTLDMSMSGGRRGNLSVEPASLHIEGLAHEDATTVDLTIVGQAREIMEYLAHPFLGYAQTVGIESKNIDGLAALRLQLTFPLHDNLSFDEVEIEASANLRDLRLRNVFPGYEISRGDLALALDATGMNVTGPIALNDVSLWASWRYNFKEGSPYLNRYTANGVLSDIDRERLGIDLKPYLQGPVTTDVAITEPGNGTSSWSLSADLREAGLTVSALDWHKAVGIPGGVQFNATVTPGEPVAIEAIKIVAGDLEASGRAKLAADTAGVDRLELDHLVIGENRLHHFLFSRDAAGFVIDLEAESLDWRPFLERLYDSGETTLPSFNLTAEASRVIVTDGHVLEGVKTTATVSDDHWKTATLDGTLPGGGFLKLDLGDRGERRSLEIESNDAGTVMRVFDIFQNAVGGELEVSVFLNDPTNDQLVAGRIRVRDFRLVRAPTLARILNRASLTGIYTTLTGEAGKGIKFSELFAPFIMEGDRLTFKSARMFGPTLGLTMAGNFDFDSDSADLSGTLVPEYTINSALGKVPLVGDLIVGGKGGGLFAATYAVEGPIEAPTITVNPLAALAPGFLRALISPGADVSVPDGQEFPGFEDEPSPR